MATQVGSAYGELDLRITKLRSSIRVAKREIADLDAALRSVGNTDPFRGMPQRAPQGLTRTRQALSDLERQQIRNQAANLRFQSAQAALEAQTGDYERAIQRLNRALASQSATTTQTIAAQRQLLRIQQQQARATAAAAPAQRGGGLGSLAGLAGGFGLAFGVTELASLGIEAGETANRVELLQASINALAKDQDTYNRLLRIAADNQRLLGGSIEANLEPMRQLLLVSNRTGAGLEELNRTSQLLATVNPAEGLEGAGFALSEFLSGDTTSIVERFNLPRQALNDIKNSGADAATQLQMLNALLAEQGVTMEALGARTQTTAYTYEQFGVTVERTGVRFGNFLARTFEEPTRGLTQLLQGNLQSAYLTFNETLLRSSGNLQGFSEWQENATRAVLSFIGIQDAATQEMDRATQATIQQTDATTQLYLASQSGTTALQQAQQAIQEHTLSLQADAAESLINAAETEHLSLVKDQLRQQAEQAAMALLAAGDAGAVTAQRLAGSSSQVDQLTAAYYRLYQAQSLIGIIAQQEAQTRRLTAPGAGNFVGRAAGRNNDVDAVYELQKAQQAAEDATRRQNMALADQSEQVAILRDELADLTPGTEAYIDKQTALLLAEQRLESGRTKASRAGGSARLSDQQRVNNQILSAIDTYHRKREEAEREHTERVAEIYEEYYDALEEAQKDFEQNQLDGRVSFYDSLVDIEDSALQQQLSAQYEQAVLRAQEIGGDAGDAYLQAAERAITEQGQRQQRILELEKKAREGGRDERAEAEAALEFERGRLELQQRADEARLKRIEEEGSAIEETRDEQLDAEQTRYQEQLDDIGRTLEDTTEAKVLAAQRAGKAVSDENLALAEQKQLLEDIGKNANAIVPGAAPVVPQVPVAAPAAAVTAPPALPFDAAQQVQDGIAAVFDGAVVNAILAQSAMQDGHFRNLINAVGAVERRVGDVERAIGRQRMGA